MGLIRVGLGAIAGTFADQWKEYIYCDAMGNDVLVARGQKMTNGKNNGHDNIITAGSGIAVADGQCMVIVEDGKVIEVCAEPGNFTFDNSSEPSLFTGSFGEALAQTIDTIAKRFTFAGETGKDQRVYYINTKEIMDNKFGTLNPVPFRICDFRINLDVDVTLKCSGTYTFRVFDPVLFYESVAGNVRNEFTKDEISDQLRSELVGSLQPALGKLSALGLRPSELVNYTKELANGLNEELDSEWGQRGLEVVKISLTSVTLPADQQQMITDAQKAAMLTNPEIANANVTSAKIDALRKAAENQGGSILGLAGVNMVDQFANNMQQNVQVNGWTCSQCGAVNTGNFCSNCGTPRVSTSWTCECGTVNTGKFCSNCGGKKPE